MNLTHVFYYLCLGLKFGPAAYSHLPCFMRESLVYRLCLVCFPSGALNRDCSTIIPVHFAIIYSQFSACMCKSEKALFL